MKLKFISLICLLLAVLMLTVSCSSGNALMSLGKQDISLNLYELYLSRQKGTLCTAYYYGAEAAKDSFWDTQISTDGTTNNKYWTEYILQCVKIYLAAMYMYEEEYDLSLPDSAEEAVKEKLDELVATDGEGSKAALNKILSEYGINYNMLREAYLIEQKVAHLQYHLYGDGLSKVSKELKEQYYRENYVRFKQVFFMNYRYVYETDENGDTIYFDTETGKPIYDESGIRHFDSNGFAEKDKNGNIIYYHEDGSIAYDEKNGQPSYTYDENGKYQTAKLTASELRELEKNAEDIAEFTEKGDTATFESYIAKYSDDSDGQSNYSDGYYFAVNAAYAYEYIADIISKLTEMEAGEIGLIESDYGYHVIMKYELDEGAYEDTAKDVWFESETNSFTDGVKQWLFNIKCEQYLDKITVNPEAVKQIDIKSVSPNFYY